jgi:hypothetical protein
MEQVLLVVTAVLVLLLLYLERLLHTQGAAVLAHTPLEH